MGRGIVALTGGEFPVTGIWKWDNQRESEDLISSSVGGVEGLSSLPALKFYDLMIHET